MFQQQDLYSQKSLLNSIQNILDKRVENIYQEAYNRGKKDFFKSLFNDYRLWSDMKEEWGKGTGYKKRIVIHTEGWFLNQNYHYFDRKNSQELNLMWKELLNEINNLITDN